ncbi:hypothetical protein KXD93_14930 [Mucilaginibacter sp. BJC16-A38]|uniref:hypothetical protein n=1 Tax=Mucilaginibacter phenanthrenivorans TaxID=1234842 RepID=UPI0021589806|nr:hypothetical protein [Mucilaginibacter phenanthrenivorans]MCR8558949.1 hypothetical protein [Mucilaginibacter phenanthrenivorans]
MKKVIYTLVFLAVANMASAQLFNKLKNKLTGGAAQSAKSQVTGQAAPSTSTAPDGTAIKYTDPAKFGTILMNFSQQRRNASPDGFDIWFRSVEVVNNQIVAKIADYNMAMYSYKGGVLQQTGETPDMSIRNSLKNGSEWEQRSIDFTQTDQGHAIMKDGRSVSSGMIPGKADQSMTFNGKGLGGFAMFQVAHNADSSVIAVSGASFTGGMNYHLVSSSGLKVQLPKLAGTMPMISPDGKSVGAFSPTEMVVYMNNGAKQPVKNTTNNQMWLRNTGNVFYVPSSKVLERNGALFYNGFNNPIDLKLLFLNANETGMAWEGYRGLYFSDGTVFENASSPTKVVIDNKEVIVFLDVDLSNGNLYLCKHDL